MKQVASRISLSQLTLHTKRGAAVLLGLAALAVAAGAAAGGAMQGDIDGKVPITVSQALVVERPQRSNFPPNRKFFGSTSDDQTKFSIAMEMFRGESLTVLVPIVNRSSGDMVAQLALVIPDVPTGILGLPGLTLQVTGSGKVIDTVQVSPDTWTFTAPALINGLAGSPPPTPAPPDGLLLTFTTAATALSGFFEITGRIRVQEF